MRDYTEKIEGLKAQQEQQRLLSNQSAENAARNANMVSENQTQQFMANLNTQTKQFNAQQSNAMKQFNAAAENAAEARDANRTADMNKFWDGQFNGRLVPEGSYFYNINLVGEDRESFTKLGEIEVIY